MIEVPYHIDILKFRLQRNYSVRSFAKFLGVSPSVLSRALRGKRNLAPQTAKVMIDKLGLSPVAASLFYTSATTYKSIPAINSKFIGEVMAIGIRLWHYYKKTSFALCNNGQNNPKIIANELNIFEGGVVKLTEHLEKLGLIKRDEKDSWKFIAQFPIFKKTNE